MVQTKHPRLPFVLKPYSRLQRTENSSWWTRANTQEPVVEEPVWSSSRRAEGLVLVSRPSLMHSQIELCDLRC